MVFDYCSSDRDQNKDSCHHVIRSTYIFVVVVFSVMSVISIVALVYIFSAKRSSERPFFVSLSMILLNLMLVCYIAFFAMVGEESLQLSGFVIPKISWFSNMVAIIGNIFWLIHDWLYTEQYLSACFYMPIAISIFEDTEPEDLLDPSLSSIDKKAQKKQNQARWALWILRGIYYSILAVYVMLGSFSTRLEFN